VGQAILPGAAFQAAFSDRTQAFARSERRLKAGCSQDWLPHNMRRGKRALMNGLSTPASGLHQAQFPLDLYDGITLAETPVDHNLPITPPVANFSPLAAQLSRPQVFAGRIRPIRAKPSKG